jgi:hypothetical protein
MLQPLTGHPTGASGTVAAPSSADDVRIPLGPYLWLLGTSWSLVIVGSLTWNLIQSSDEALSTAMQTARSVLGTDLRYLQESILQGNVYVPVKSLSDPASGSAAERLEATASNGERLTLLNPMLLTRELYRGSHFPTNTYTRVTSLNPIRKRNEPDEWERKALLSFAANAAEASDVVKEDGQRYFRLMRPLVTVPACLNCHEEKDRKVNTVRGGIGIKVAVSAFQAPAESLRLTLAHLALWGAGLAGLSIVARSLKRHIAARQRVEIERERLIGELKEALGKVKTLRGMIPICSSCKKIRNDTGSWTQLELYLKEHSEAEFSHGLCLDCMRKLYPGLSKKVEDRLKAEGLDSHGMI